MNICYRFSLTIVLAISTILIYPAIALTGMFDRPDFFDKGREQFEEEIRRFDQEGSVPESNLKLDEGSLPWSRIVNEQALFAILMPSGMMSQETEIVEAPEGDIKFTIIASHPSSSSRYVVAYSEEVAPERVANSQEVLEGAQEEIMENESGLEKIADDDITFKDYPGKQFQLQNDKETIVYRLILVEQRLYVLAANQGNDELAEDYITTFFESFQLLES